MAKPPTTDSEEYAFEVLARARYGRVPSPGTSMDGAIALNFIIRPYTISFHAFSPIRAKGRMAECKSSFQKLFDCLTTLMLIFTKAVFNSH